jgi:hypothetical protein
LKQHFLFCLCFSRCCRYQIFLDKSNFKNGFNPIVETGMDINKISCQLKLPEVISQTSLINLGWGIFAGISMSLAIAAPSFAQSAISLDRNFRDDPATLRGEGGGSTSIARIAGIADNCRGFAHTAPNHTITLKETFPLMDILVYTSNINDDPTMLVKGPNGIVICADDESGGRYPQVSRRLPKGDYQIWVGSKTTNQSFPYTLSLSEIHQK